MVSWKRHTSDTFANHLSLPSQARLGAIFHPRREKRARETWDRLNDIHGAQQLHEYPTPFHSPSDPETFIYIDFRPGAEQVPRRAAHRHSGQTRAYAPPYHQQQSAHYASSYQRQPQHPQNLHYPPAYHHQPQHVYAQQTYYGQHEHQHTQHSSHRTPQHGKKQESRGSNKQRERYPKAGYGAQPSGPSAAEVMLAGGYTTSLLEKYPHRALY
ncbi:hypothetical protein BDZ89DRAFT_1168811 [Hymenopellis radicata]|nr:hypothetical protein BDZ89DRAFT_1168811 [Hymenopellis radicata]